MSDKEMTGSNPDTLDKEARCVQLRRMGLTFSQIAKEVGYTNAGGAYKAFQRAYDRIIVEDVKEIRTVALERLDFALRGIMDAVGKGSLGAIDRMLRIEERRARLLGLDAPVRQEIEINHYERDTLDAELSELLNLMDSRAQSVVVETESTSGVDS